MSDTPQGGWWKAKDGKWYPPETHPDFTSIATAEVPAGPPAAGWWQANDGNWYPPETHPEQQPHPTIDLTEGAASAAPIEAPAEHVATQHAVAGEASGPPIWDLTPSSTIDTAAEGEVADAPTAPPLGRAVPLQEEPSADPAPVEPRPSMFVAPPLLGVDDLGSTPATNGNGSGGDAGAAWGPPPGSSSPADAVEMPSPAAVPPLTGPGDSTPLDLTPLAEPDGVTELDQGDPDAPLPGWRKGADGAWYPPNQEPPIRSAVFPNANRPSGPSVLGGAVDPARPAKRRRKVPFIAAGVALLVLVAVVIGVMALGGDDETETVAQPNSTTTSTTASTTTVAQPPPSQASGTTSGTVDVGRDVSEQYLALVTFDGTGAFRARLLDAEGDVSQELVPSGVTGRYLGVTPVNFATGQSFRSVQVDGEGAWAVTFAVLSSVESVSTDSGSAYQGTGDQVLEFPVERSTQIRVACQDCGSLIEVLAWSEDATGAEELPLVGGEVVVPSGTTYLQVIARGAAGASGATWTLAVV
jgi:hypothetical protein